MASRNFDAGRTPRDIAATLNLTAGTNYVGQNLSQTATLFLRDAAVRPSPGMRAFRHEAGAFFYFTPVGTTSLWAWSDEDTCPVLITEA